MRDFYPRSKDSEMNFSRLLAKSSKNPGNPNDRETLPRHIKDVVKCANAILESIGFRSLQAMKIGVERGDELSSAVLRGAWLHDIGKANHQFQKMIRQGSPFPQALRHEWIGV